MFKVAYIGPVVMSMFACQASAGANARVDTSGEASAKAQLSSQSSPARNAAPTRTAVPEEIETNTSGTRTPAAMLGARAGLSIVATKPATCQCLSVVVGNPDDSRFRWEGAKPITDASSQLVVGISSNGLECPQAAKDSLGASYHGYESQGGNVVVEVETARLGRPVVEGAVVPRPTSGGKLVVRAVETNSPYGRGLNGATPECIVWTAP